MTGFQHLSVRLKILSVAGLGIFLFLAYFLYSYYIAETNIDHLRQVESHDFPVLELVNANVPATIAASSPMCADRTQTIDLDAPSFSQGNRSDILFVRACVIVDPLFPGLGLGLQLPKDASGGFQMIAFSAFVNEPE